MTFHYFCNSGFNTKLQRITMSEIMQIDIAQIVKKKAGNKWVPGFLVKYLTRIVHQDLINQVLRDTAPLKNIEFMEAAFKFLNVTIEAQGKENLPHGDRYIFAGNHPLGGLDGVAIGYLVGKEYDGKIRFFSNDLLTNLEPMKELFIPVNKFGSQSRESARLTEELYQSDKHLVTFPAGVCSRRIKGKICDLEWKKNFIHKSVQYQRDVIPVYFEGRNSNFFYNLANFRKFIGLKFNVEMMYLADELFKQMGKKFVIKFGKPIPWQTFDNSKTQTEWAQYVKDITYKMA